MALKCDTLPQAPAVVIVVGSHNPVKVASVRLAFEQAFPHAMLLVEGVSAPSGVTDQPMTDEETRTGARNRASNAAKLYTDAHAGTAPVFAVGLEGGCADEELVAGQKDLVCFAWMAVLHVASGHWGIGKTGIFTLPPAVAALVRDGVELGIADDRVFGRTNSKQADGAVGLLSHSLIDRTQYYTHALILALIPFISHEYYGAPRAF
jgi:inosine/xanthosine triphosphatase